MNEWRKVEEDPEMWVTREKGLHSDTVVEITVCHDHTGPGGMQQWQATAKATGFESAVLYVVKDGDDPRAAGVAAMNHHLADIASPIFVLTLKSAMS